MKKSILVVLATAGLLLAGASSASAGEVNGNGGPAQGAANARSECAFSGLEDGDNDGDGLPDPGEPHGPGATPQNFGQTWRVAKTGAFGPDFTSMQFIQSTGNGPSVACNGHLSPSK